MKVFSGKVLFLDREDINTDEIIPARYLTEISKKALGPHLLEDLELPGFDPRRDICGKSVIIARRNFGCGSSREHAAWALEENGIRLVIAPGFARIFRQNMFNCGMMAVSIEEEFLDGIFRDFADTETHVNVDLQNRTVVFSSDKKKTETVFSISAFDESLVKAGGWVEYADSRY